MQIGALGNIGECILHWILLWGTSKKHPTPPETYGGSTEAEGNLPSRFRAPAFLWAETFQEP